MLKSYLWIIDCIKSCKNEFQLACCKQLIKFFEDRYTGEEMRPRCLNGLNTTLESTSILMSEDSNVIS